MNTLTELPSQPHPAALCHLAHPVPDSPGLQWLQGTDGTLSCAFPAFSGSLLYLWTSSSMPCSTPCPQQSSFFLPRPLPKDSSNPKARKIWRTYSGVVTVFTETYVLQKKLLLTLLFGYITNLEDKLKAGIWVHKLQDFNSEYLICPLKSTIKNSPISSLTLILFH